MPIRPRSNGSQNSPAADLDPTTPGVQRVREGSHTLDGDAYDILSKKTSFQAGQLKIDRSEPTGTISGVGEGELLRDRDYNITATSTDRYSGSKTIVLKVDGVEKKRREECPATTDPCTVTWTLDAGDQGLGDGEHTLAVETSDQLGNSGGASRSFRVDRTAPALTLRGQLWDRRGSELESGSYELTADAQDGSAGDRDVGVRRVEIFLDGESVKRGEQECAQGNCGLSSSWTLVTAEHPGGEHRVEVVAEDHVGRETRQDFTFRSGGCCFGASAPWGAAGVRSPMFFGDVDGDGAV